MEFKTEQLAYIEQRLSNDRKSTLLAYALWFFLGLFGAHRFYLRKRFAWLQPILGGLGNAKQTCGGVCSRDWKKELLDRLRITRKDQSNPKPTKKQHNKTQTECNL